MELKPVHLIVTAITFFIVFFMLYNQGNQLKELKSLISANNSTPIVNTETTSNASSMPLTMQTQVGTNVSSVSVIGTGYAIASNATLVQLTFQVGVVKAGTASSFTYAFSNPLFAKAKPVLISAFGSSGNTGNIQIIPDLTNQTVLFNSNMDASNTHVITLSFSLS